MKKPESKEDRAKTQARIEVIEKIERGGLWQRALACGIDGIIFWVLKEGIHSYFLGSIPAETISFRHYLGVWVLFIAVVVVYNGLFISLRGATPGKIVMKLQIADMNTARFPDFVNANLREFAKILSAVILFYGFLMAFRREDRRTLHDLMLNTVVVKVR